MLEHRAEGHKIKRTRPVLRILDSCQLKAAGANAPADRTVAERSRRFQSIAVESIALEHGHRLPDPGPDVERSWSPVAGPKAAKRVHHAREVIVVLVEIVRVPVGLG